MVKYLFDLDHLAEEQSGQEIRCWDQNGKDSPPQISTGGWEPLARHGAPHLASLLCPCFLASQFSIIICSLTFRVQTTDKNSKSLHFIASLRISELTE